MSIVLNILLSPFLYNNTMYTMATLVSTASALHFMVKLTFPFLWRVCLEKAFLLLARDNVLVLHILH